MEGKVVRSFAFAVLGFFTSIMATNLDKIATYFIAGGFLLIALDRLVLLLLIQLKRLNRTQLLIQKWLNPFLLLLLTLGLIFGKVLAGDTFFPIPFGYFVQLALSYTVCVITGIFQFREYFSLLDKE